MPKVKTKTLIKRADKLFTELIHKRGSCQKCGRVQALQTAHIFSRTNKHLRWSEDNVLLLCAGCHFWAHQNPILFTKFVEENFQVQYLFLLREHDKKEYNAGTTLEFTIKDLQEKLNA